MALRLRVLPPAHTCTDRIRAQHSLAEKPPVLPRTYLRPSHTPRDTGVPPAPLTSPPRAPSPAHGTAACPCPGALLLLPAAPFGHPLALPTFIKISPSGNCILPPPGFPWSRSNYLSLIALIGGLTGPAAPLCPLYPSRGPGPSRRLGFERGRPPGETALTSCPQFARAT